MLDPMMKGHREALERHHLFPKAYLARIGIADDRDRNQIANFALVEWNRNNAISDDPPAEYFPRQIEAHQNMRDLRENLRLHALPDGWETMEYKEFLEKRRVLMATIQINHLILQLQSQISFCLFGHNVVGCSDFFTIRHRNRRFVLLPPKAFQQFSLQPLPPCLNMKRVFIFTLYNIISLCENLASQLA